MRNTSQNLLSNYNEAQNIPMKYLPESTVQKLVEEGTVREYPAGQLILYEGDPASQVFYVYEGTIKMYDIDANGNEKIVALAGKGDLFPILQVFVDSPDVTSFYSTLSEVKTIVIPRDVFMKHVQNDPQLGLYCMEWFTRTVKYLVERISSLEKTDTQAKLNAVLMLLCEVHSHKRLSGWRRVTFPVNQQLLADLIGVTRESVNGAVKIAQQKNIMRMPKSKVLEINKKNLQKLVT